MSAYSRLLERARVLWRGPSPAPALPRSSGGAGRFLERVRVVWRGPAPAPALPRSSGAVGGFLERVGVLWRGPAPAATRRSAAGSKIAAPPCSSQGIGSRAPGLTFDESFGSTRVLTPPPDANGCALVLAEVREINQKIGMTSSDEMKWFKIVRELLITVALCSGLTMKECVDRLLAIWELYNADEVEDDDDDDLDYEIHNLLGQIHPW